MHYEDFFLQIHPPRGEEYPVTVHCPAGDGDGTFRIPLPRLEPDGTAGQAASGRDFRALRPEAAPEEVGALLFEALFQDEVLRLLSESLAGLPQDGGHGLRIKLCFDPEAVSLGRLPWEELFWMERRQPLCLGRSIALVRYLNVPRGVRPPLAPPLRVLLASACPIGYESLNLETEAEAVREALARVPGLQVERLRNATPQGLRDKLLEAPFHVFHFLGHGGFAPDRGEGLLLLEDGERGPARLPGRILGHLLRDFPSLQLAFLNACRTAASAGRGGLDPFAGVASSLVLAGVPAVLAMRLAVSDGAAIRFSKAFYRRIAAGDPVDAATAEGRMAVLLEEPSSTEWSTPALFLRRWDGRLLQAAGPASSPDGSLAEIRREIHDSSRLLQDKTEGFVGRRWVFDAIEAFTRGNPRGYFVVSGDPGIGKTALIAELVKRERLPHHFNVRAEGLQRPEQFLRNICAQLVTTYGLDPSPLPADATTSPRYLNSLLEKVSARLEPGEKAALVVDALDETDLSLLAPGANALYLPVRLPPGIYIVVSNRRGGIPLRIECEQASLEIGQDSPHNLEDIREYVEGHLPRAGIRAYLAAQGLEEEAFTIEMVRRSEGNFMYLRYVMPEIERGEHQSRPFEKLPIGLTSYYETHWERMRSRHEEAWFDSCVPVLAALTAVREPVSFHDVLRFSGLADRHRAADILQRWAQFLYVEQTQDGAGRTRKRYRLYHSSFFDFISSKVNLEEAHRRIADALWDEP